MGTGIRWALPLVLLLGAVAWAQAPRTWVYEMRLPNPDAARRLVDLGLVIDEVTPERAVVYADEAERMTVESLGWPVRLLEIQPVADEKTVDGYRDSNDIAALFAQWATNYPGLCQVYTLGYSVQNRPILAIKITANPDTPADKPAVRYIATIHGDEPVGTEMCLYFAEWLLTSYGTDSRATRLVDETVCWLLPLMNPDGLVLRTRRNANGTDLNRNFPVYATDFSGPWLPGQEISATLREPEVATIMNWTASERFVVSGTFHGGSLVANYPYDYEPGVPSGTAALSPDEDLFQYVALRYAMYNPDMYASTQFPQGIVNGSAWYSATGTLQDWCYRMFGTLELTLEIGYTKKPAISTMPTYWARNRDAMISYLETALEGVRGITRNRVTGEPVETTVWVNGNSQPVFSSPTAGNYHRVLLPGTYAMRWEAAGYIPWRQEGIVVGKGPATRVDVDLSDGDLNDDRAVNASDIQLSVNALLGEGIPGDADVDGLGLSITDLQWVVNRAIAKAMNDG